MVDLGLGDIFQIVSLSRRSGVLQLRTPDDSGEIIFSDGKVTGAQRERNPKTISEILLAEGVISAERHQEVLNSDKDLKGKDALTSLDADPEKLDEVLRATLENTIYAMFEWDVGSFAFHLDETPQHWEDFSLVGRRVAVESGLNPQFLAMEGVRLKDEAAHKKSLESGSESEPET
ncbi:DUF4388 domain-containing protein, partial [Myxococcota bacterium]|nr:DUF4388 domain-containing protein [Myxococcota bacterium]